jgi:adenine-specific DNA-methyltransferase
MINGLRNIENWRNKLGLYPLSLFQNSKNQFILLNGSSNSFCIDFDTVNKDPRTYLNFAWSSDVESCLRIRSDNIFVYKWGKKSNGIENINTQKVYANLESFYEYLGQGQFHQENSIVQFIMRIYDRLRNLTGESDGKKSLKALLYLLAVSFEDRIIDIRNWGLDSVGKDLLVKNNTTILDELVNEFKKGIIYYDLQPNLDLILRHTSGRLFQEAHYKALINSQIDLWGLPSDSLIQKSNKILSGAYFTPSYITRCIVEECLYYLNLENKNKITVFDPACGSGEFLKEAIRQLRIKGFKGIIKVIGWDISESAIDMARFILNFEKRQSEINNIDIDIQFVENSLSKEWIKDVDLLLMNPPYQSWELLDDDQRDSVRSVLGDFYFRNPNISSAFLWKAVKEIKNEGILGCVFPSSIFNADSYVKLRNEIANLMNHKLIGKLGNYIFYGALVDASIYIAQRTDVNIQNDKIILWSNNIKNAASNAIRGLRKHHLSSNSVINENNFSVYRNFNIGELDKPWTPVSYNSLLLKENLERQVNLGLLVKIEDLFNIRQGVRTGKNGIFLIDKSFYEQQLKSKEQKYFRPAITNDAIRNGIINVIKYIWFPYGDNIIPIKSEKDLELESGTFYKTHLYPNKNLLKKRSNIKNWWDLSRYYKWNYNKISRLVSTEFGKSDSFAFDESGEFIVERGNAWIPKVELNKEIYFAYLAIFCSPFFDEMLSVYSKQILSGYFLGNIHVKDIPIPDFTKPGFTSDIKKLAIYAENISNKISIDYIELTNTVKSIYGIN